MAYNVFLAHNRNVPDALIDQWVADVENLLTDAWGTDVNVTSGRDDFVERASDLGGWKSWMQDVVTGTRLNGSPRYDVLVVPLGGDEIDHGVVEATRVGKATMEMCQLAAENGRDVYGWFNGTEHFVRVVDFHVHGDDWKEYASPIIEPLA